MSLLQPTPTTANDPYDITRLANELAERDDANSNTDTDGGNDHVDLPSLATLAHGNPYLTAEVFSVEDFLLSRAHTSLPDLGSELKEYHKQLKEELVQLINDDYEAFISLSTDLRGEGERLMRLKAPLGGLKEEIQVSSTELKQIQDAVQEKLSARAALREEKAILHLLLKVSDSVTRLETLLAIASPEEDSDLTATTRQDRAGLGVPLLDGKDHDPTEDRSFTNRAKHLSRVSTEYTQLLYHAEKARSEKCVFVDEMQWRIDRIRSTISSDLDHLFTTTVHSLTTGKDGQSQARATEVEKARWLSDLTECLRSYNMLRLWRDAEDVLRKEVVRPFVKQNLFPGSLTVPHSPVLPRTPFQNSSHPNGTNGTNSLHPLRTPYTPYTAFASKQNPFESQFGSSAAAQPSYLLDDTSGTNALASVYNKLLRFVDRDLRRIMEIAERVSTQTSSAQRPIAEHVMRGTALHVVEDRECFDIMANVVWADIGRAVMDELGNVVFAAGRPDEFRKNYETTQAFLRSLEFLAPSLAAVEHMRAHPSFSAFERRWQLPVYFQLRWKEIVSKLEDALGGASTSAAPPPKDAFISAQTAATWEAVQACWSADNYLPELGHRFWRFTLQLISRYKVWLDINLPPLEPSAKVASAAASEKNSAASPGGLLRTGTPNPNSESASAESVAVDDGLLRQCASAITDIKSLEKRVMALWRDEISVLLPPEISEDANEEFRAEDVLKHSLSALTSLVPPLSAQIITILSRRSCDALLPVRSIPAQFRMMPNARPPAEASRFVPTILRPIRTFFGMGAEKGHGEALKDEFLIEYATCVFDSAAQRYVSYITAMRKTEESLKKLKTGRRTNFSLFGSGGGTHEESRDAERVRVQMILDVEAFGHDAASLGVDVNYSKDFKALKYMVHSTESESDGA